MHSAWGCTGSAPRRTSSRRWHAGKDGGCSPSPAPAIPRLRTFARELGAEWAGGSDQPPPEPLDAAIIFAPVGPLVPAALRAVERGGTVVCAGIHMSPIPSFPYDILWGERVVRSVANLTRRDGEEFLELAPKVPVQTRPLPYPAGAGQPGAGRSARRQAAGRGGAGAVASNADP